MSKLAAERRGRGLAVLRRCSGEPTQGAMRDAKGIGLAIGQTVAVLSEPDDLGHVSVEELDSKHPGAPWEVLAVDLDLLARGSR